LYIPKLIFLKWENLRWDDQIAIKKSCGEKIEDTPEEKKREQENRQLWKLKDELADNVPTK
jgi:hypothetical protein